MVNFPLNQCKTDRHTSTVIGLNFIGLHGLENARLTQKKRERKKIKANILREKRKDHQRIINHITPGKFSTCEFFVALGESMLLVLAKVAISVPLVCVQEPRFSVARANGCGTA